MRDDILTEPGAAELRIRLAADTASVPGARRFVSDGLRAWGRGELVDDAALCVSELAGNAALHSASSFMEIAVSGLEQSVRISVEDDGLTPAQAVVPRATFTAQAADPDVMLAQETTTGRGLGIVSVLASDWGVEPTPEGKVVWLTLDEGGEEHPVRMPTTEPSRWAVPPRALDQAMPEGWGLVRLQGCPVGLSLRQDRHLDELVRELQLIEGDAGNPRSRELAERLEGLLSGPAYARHTGRRTAQQAAVEGRTHIDVDMAMPRELGRQVIALQQAVAEADLLCEEKRLLTLASEPEVVALRAWMTEQIIHQLEDGAEPVSWATWRARQVSSEPA